MHGTSECYRVRPCQPRDQVSESEKIPQCFDYLLGIDRKRKPSSIDRKFNYSACFALDKQHVAFTDDRFYFNAVDLPFPAEFIKETFDVRVDMFLDAAVVSTSGSSFNRSSVLSNMYFRPSVLHRFFWSTF